MREVKTVYKDKRTHTPNSMINRSSSEADLKIKIVSKKSKKF